MRWSLAAFLALALGTGACDAGAADAWKIHWMPEASAAAFAGTPTEVPDPYSQAPAEVADPYARQVRPEERVHRIRTRTTASPERARRLPEASVAPLTDEQAETLLDYRQYARVEAGMRARLSRNPHDAMAWHWLAAALQAQGRDREAAEARIRARRLGGGSRNWHVSLSLGALADSNVVVAPDAVSLPARDRGDIGARIGLAVSGSPGEGVSGLAWRLGYRDMVYQDFNAYALRTLEGAAAMHWRSGSRDAWAGVRVEGAQLGGGSLFAGAEGLAGIEWRPGDFAYGLSAVAGRRNFSAAFSDFSAFRWRLDLSAGHEAAERRFSMLLGAGEDRTRLPEEAFREFQLGLDGSLPIVRWHGALRLGVQAHFARRRYLHRDARPFLIRSQTRRDRELGLGAELAWQRKASLWGGKAGETWYVHGAWIRHDSTIDAAAVFDPAQSRAWRRWRIEGGVRWYY